MDLDDFLALGLLPLPLAMAEAKTIIHVGGEIVDALPGRPQGDPDALTAAGQSWQAVGARLTSVIDGTRRQVEGLDGAWQGKGQASFETQWTELAAAADEAAVRLNELGEALIKAAAQLAEAQRKYDIAVGVAVVTNIVGLGLSFVTFGASEAAAAGLAAGTVAAAIGLGEVAAELIAAIVEDAVLIAEQVALRFAVQFAADLGTQAVISAVVYPDHDPLRHLDVRGAAGTALGDSAPPARVLPIENKLARFAVHAAVSEGFKEAGNAVSPGSVNPEKVALFALLGDAEDAVIAKIFR